MALFKPPKLLKPHELNPTHWAANVAGFGTLFNNTGGVYDFVNRRIIPWEKRTNNPMTCHLYPTIMGAGTRVDADWHDNAGSSFRGGYAPRGAANRWTQVFAVTGNIDAGWLMDGSFMNFDLFSSWGGIAKWRIGDWPQTPLNTTGYSNTAPNVFACTWDGTNARAYLNGVLNATTTSAYNATPSDVFMMETTAGAGAGGRYPGGFDHHFGFYFSSVFTDAQVWEISNNPFALAKPLGPKRRFYFLESPNTSTNVAVFPGAQALAVTGYAPTVSANAAASAFPGYSNLTVTTYGVTVAAGCVALPGAGSLATTGYAPTASASAAAAIGLGTATATGYAPVASASVTASPGYSTPSYTGYAPTPSAGTDVSAAPGTATLAYTGYAPVASAGVLALPGVSARTYTGYGPTVSTGADATAAPGVGALTYTGYAPSPSAGVTAAPGAGSTAYTGYAPTDGAGSGASAFPGWHALAVTTYAPTGSAGVTASPGTQSCAGTGAAPSPSVGCTAAPGAGEVAYTGYAPGANVGGNVSVSVGLGTLTITSYAPSPVTDNLLTPGTGSVAYTGLPIAPSSASNAAPGAGSGVITMLPPGASTSSFVNAGIAALVTTGYGPSRSVGIGVQVPGVSALISTGYPSGANFTLPPYLGKETIVTVTKSRNYADILKSTTGVTFDP